MLGLRQNAVFSSLTSIKEMDLAIQEEEEADSEEEELGPPFIREARATTNTLWILCSGLNL